MTPPRDPSTRPLRILHLTAGSDAGGLSRYIYDLCSAMHALGHDVTVAGERGVWHDLFAAAPFPWIDVPLKGNPLALMRATNKLATNLQRPPTYDVLHTHYRRPTLVARRLQRRMRRAGAVPIPPILYTLHLSHLSLRWPWRVLSDFGDHTHAPSHDAADWLTTEARVPADRVTVIPHGIDPDKFPLADPTTRAAARAHLSLPPDATVAAFVGRFDTPKNEDWLLDLAVATRQTLPSLHILLLGRGPNGPALLRRIQSENLSPHVRLLPYGDPLPLYQAADALLLPSTREGFSLVCAEAMSVGIPVLRTRTSGTSELIIENVTGRSTPIRREDFLAAALDFLQDRAALARMGTAAAAHIRQHFTFARQVHDTIALYRRLIPA